MLQNLIYLYMAAISTHSTTKSRTFCLAGKSYFMLAVCVYVILSFKFIVCTYNLLWNNHRFCFKQLHFSWDDFDSIIYIILVYLKCMYIIMIMYVVLVTTTPTPAVNYKLNRPNYYVCKMFLCNSYGYVLKLFLFVGLKVCGVFWCFKVRL